MDSPQHILDEQDKVRKDNIPKLIQWLHDHPKASVRLHSSMRSQQELRPAIWVELLYGPNDLWLGDDMLLYEKSLIRCLDEFLEDWEGDQKDD